ncbi:MAG: hypothetical protein LUE64_06025 [Candidatus Gastranaerophilales bacterium]|nr:hypothetical protein [Candidatus Gastranaerophilales bacterium]
MNFTCSNEQYLKNVLKTCLNSYEYGSTVNISYDVIKQTKTLKQLGFIFGGLIKAINLFFNNVGYNFPSYALKEWLYQECGIYETETLPNGATFQSHKTLSEMTKKEALEFIEKVIVFIDSSEIFTDFIFPPELRYCWTHNIDNDKLQTIKNSSFPNFDTLFLRHQSRLTCVRCGARGGMVYHLNRPYKKDYFSLPVCAKCYDYATTHGESKLINDIKSVLNGMSVDDFCLYAYYLFRKNY